MSTTKITSSTLYLIIGVKCVFIAAVIMLYGFLPQINNAIGEGLNIGCPPIIDVLLGPGVILIKLLITNIERASMQVTINCLAMLEADLADHSNEKVKYKRSNSYTGSTLMSCL